MTSCLDPASASTQSWVQNIRDPTIAYAWLFCSLSLSLPLSPSLSLSLPLSPSLSLSLPLSLSLCICMCTFFLQRDPTPPTAVKDIKFSSSVDAYRSYEARGLTKGIHKVRTVRVLKSRCFCLSWIPRCLLQSASSFIISGYGSRSCRPHCYCIPKTWICMLRTEVPTLTNGSYFKLPFSLLTSLTHSPCCHTG